ncbi:MAG: 3TM-type holin [Paracoccaceae bacterium]
MGLIAGLLEALFGSGRNMFVETAEIFRPNAEAEARRDASAQSAALAQFAAEFAAARPGAFDRAIDGLNRVPRPALALGTLGLLVSAMVDPVWFAARMEGLALVPEPLWWLLGAVVSFYFGARHQAKGHDMQRRMMLGLAATAALRPAETVPASGAESPRHADTGPGALLTLETTAPDPNPALADWRRVPAGPPATK